MIMQETSPDGLLAAAQAGDRAALESLLVTHRNGVYRYSLTVCRTTEDAEDAVQEALWAATRAIKTFRGSASAVATWLFTIVRRECFRRLDKLRQRREIGIDDEVIEGAVSDAPLDEILAMKQRAYRLATALSELEQIHREVIVLRDIEGLSAPEAAARLGITVDALKSRLHRARVSLRDRLAGATTDDAMRE